MFAPTSCARSLQNTLAQSVRVIHAGLRQLDYPLCDGFVAKIGTVGKSECVYHWLLTQITSVPSLKAGVTRLI